MNEQKPKPFTTPLDGIMVLMTWHCAICKQNWKSFIDQGTIRRMPSYITLKGQRVQTRRPDGSMLRAHEDCANRMLREMERKGWLKQQRDEDEQKAKKKRIIESVGDNE